MKRFFTLTILISSFLLLSCDELTPIESDAGTNLDDMTIEEVAVLINDYVGNAEAEHPSQCSTVPIGAKPCGGPWGHLVFSEKESNKKVLIRMAERYTELDSIRNVEQGRGSTCDYATKPELQIIDGACRGDRYAWNPGDILKFNQINN